MNDPVLILCLFGFALMGALPVVFFRRGRFNGNWLLTAAPFFVAGISVVAGLAGGLTAAAIAPWLAVVLQSAAVVVLASGIALLGCTVGSHREPLALWHQEEDAPSSLVTRGPYALIRHPFYASFLLLLAGTVCALPHPVTATALLFGWLQLERTARREERRLLASPFGPAYAAMMGSTGRFFPRFSPARQPARDRRRSVP